VPVGGRWPSGARWRDQSGDRDGGGLRRRRSDTARAVWWRAVCAGAARRQRASPARDRRPKCQASRALPASGRRRGDNRRRVGRSGCGRGRVFRRRRRRRLRRDGKRRGVRGSVERRDGERAVDNVFQGREDEGATRGWRARAARPCGPSVGLRSAPASSRPAGAGVFTFARTLVRVCSHTVHLCSQRDTFFFRGCAEGGLHQAANGALRSWTVLPRTITSPRASAATHAGYSVCSAA